MKIKTKNPEWDTILMACIGRVSPDGYYRLQEFKATPLAEPGEWMLDLIFTQRPAKGWSRKYPVADFGKMFRELRKPPASYDSDAMRIWAKQKTALEDSRKNNLHSPKIV